MKKIGRSDIIGQRGMAYIDGVVHSMGYVFYPTGGVEAGIDGYIELRDEQTGVVGNVLLQVQGKSTERQRLQAETDESFEFACAENDISYWLHGTAPVRCSDNSTATIQPVSCSIKLHASIETNWPVSTKRSTSGTSTMPI
jgi:hypothetical protein